MRETYRNEICFLDGWCCFTCVLNKMWHTVWFLGTSCSQSIHSDTNVDVPCGTEWDMRVSRRREFSFCSEMHGICFFLLVQRNPERVFLPHPFDSLWRKAANMQDRPLQLQIWLKVRVSLECKSIYTKQQGLWNTYANSFYNVAFMRWVRAEQATPPHLDHGHVFTATGLKMRRTFFHIWWLGIVRVFNQLLYGAYTVWFLFIWVGDAVKNHSADRQTQIHSFTHTLTHMVTF